MRLVELAGQIWKSHQKTLILLVVLLVTNLALLAANNQLLVPKVNEKETLFLKKQDEIRSLLHRRGGAAHSPEQRYVLASQDVSRFLEAIPEYKDFTALIEELMVLSNRAHLNIDHINYTSKELKESSLLQMSLSFNVVGDYEQVKTFIHSLEQSVRLLVINQVSLQGTDEKGVNLQLNLETFFRPGSRES